MFLLTSALWGQTTPNLGLNIPNTGTLGWGFLVNNNFSRLDGILGGSVTGVPITLNSPGIFSNTQMNEFTQSLVHSASPQSMYQTTQGGNSSAFATDGLVGAMIVPSGATVINGNAVSGYVTSLCDSGGRLHCNGVGGFFAGIAGSNNAAAWGINPNCYDVVGTTGTNLTCIENDMGVYGTPSFARGVAVLVGGLGTLPAGLASIGLDIETNVGNTNATLATSAFFGTQKTATVSNSYTFPQLTFGSNFWNGSASTGEYLNFGAQIGTGANPFVNYIWSHGAGTTGTITFGVGNGVQLGLEHSDGTFDSILSSNTTGTNYTHTFTPLTGNIQNTAATNGSLTIPSGLGAIPQFVGPGDQPLTIGTQSNQNIVLTPNGSGSVEVTQLTQGQRIRAGSAGALGSSQIDLDVTAFAGATPDLQIGAAIQAGAGTGAIINARGYTTGITFAANPFPYTGTNGHYNATITSGQLWLPAGKITVNAPIVIPTFWGIKGVCGMGGVTGNCTEIQASSSNFRSSCSPTGVGGMGACAGTITTAITASATDQALTGSSTLFNTGNSVIGGILFFKAVAGGIMAGSVGAGNGSAWGQIEAVTSNTAVTLSNVQVNGGGNAGGDAYALMMPIVSFANGIDNTGGNEAHEQFVQDLQIDANNLNVVPLVCFWSQENTFVRNVTISGIRVEGMQIEGSNCQNSGPFDMINIGAHGANATAGTIDIVVRGAGPPPRELANVTDADSSTPQPAIRIASNWPGMRIRNTHVENAVTGIDVNDTITCPIQCGTSGAIGGNGTQLFGIDCGGGVASTTCIKLSNSVGTLSSVNVFGVTMSTSQFTNVLNDPQNGCTATANGNSNVLGTYMLNTGGSIALNTGNCDSLSSSSSGIEVFNGSNALNATNGRGSWVQFQPGQSSGNAVPAGAAVMGTVPSSSSGTTLQTRLPMQWWHSRTGLTSGTATTIASIPLATEQVTDLSGHITVYAINPTNHQNCIAGNTFEAGAENSNGTFVDAAPTLGTAVANCTAGVTLTFTVTWQAGANPMILQVTPTTGSFTTTPTITVVFDPFNGGNSAATLPSF